MFRNIPKQSQKLANGRVQSAENLSIVNDSVLLIQSQIRKPAVERFSAAFNPVHWPTFEVVWV